MFFTFLLVPPTSVFGAANFKKSENAVNRYMKALQAGQCDSLFESVYHYDQLMYYDRQMYPKELLVKINNKYKKEWQSRCRDFEENIKKDTLSGDSFFPYITPKTHWKIIESKPREVFVKVTYGKDEAPCKEQTDDSYKSHLLKSKIYSFSISYSKGKILVDGPRDASLSSPESDTFYTDECKQEDTSN